MMPMGTIGVKVSILGPLRMEGGVKELDVLLSENATLEDLMVLLSRNQKLSLPFGKGLRPLEWMGAEFYALMVNGVPINLDALGSYRLKDRDIVTLAPLLVGGG